MENISDLWNSALKELEKKVSKPSFETWLKSTTAHTLKEDALTITAPNEFARDWLEYHYSELISETLYELTGEKLAIRLLFPKVRQKRTSISPSLSEKHAHDESNHLPQSMLNPKYTFDTFVIGSGNRFAHAASLAVAEAPAKAYNPLFIYGGVGLGKTHLMHAIGHYVLEHNPNAKVVYLSSEKFTNEFINSIRDNKAEEFRNKYRNVDVLLIDDIQFLSWKRTNTRRIFPYI